MKVFKHIVKVLFVVLTALILIIIGFFIANSIYQKSVHEIRDVEEIKNIMTDFQDFDIESCECKWKATNIVFGGVNEYVAAGKLQLSDDYYNMLSEKYNWKLASVIPIDEEDKELNMVSYVVIYELNNNRVFVSSEFQKTVFPKVFLSKDKHILYFYCHDF